MAKKKTTSKKAVKKTVKKKVEKIEVKAEEVKSVKEIPVEVVLERKVCKVPYVPPKRLWHDTRKHFNPNDIVQRDDNPFDAGEMILKTKEDK